MPNLKIIKSNELLKELRDRGYALSVWSDLDVLGRAKELNINCDKNQAFYICSQMDKKQDSNLGITWDTVDYYLEKLIWMK